ncbi:MAG: DNA topoisomerase I [Deltaproteobacteria bacterium RIFCSPLOWO2_12_FULL_60_19]|nr:MAG: DNA topoisomerase I [Deltaproteobacteria bacterium RIFCSPLOWO2_12_FULL_60_19]
MAAKNLVIVESPAKAKTLEKYLGRDFQVKASVGHIVDLPKSKLGVDIKKDFAPDFHVIQGKKKVVDDLRRAAKGKENIYLASDPDREGEAIAWHIADQIGKDHHRMHRVLINEITRKAVQEAIAHPHKLDRDKFDAQIARRILDRLVGYKISPILWKKVRRGLSAGRVQSVAVRVVCEREKEIRAFVPQEYWSLTATLEGRLPPSFQARLAQWQGEKIDKDNRIENDARVQEITASLEGRPWTIRQIEKKERRRFPTPPFVTSKLQQEAARKLGFQPQRTMQIAQHLYEGAELGSEGAVGLITYMRTDSTRVSADAVQQVRHLIQSQYGAAYLPERPVVYRSKKGAQDAHEAIRPTSMEYPPERVRHFLRRDHFALYSLIWDRFVASQMAPAVYDQTGFDIQAGEALFRATGQQLKFDGFIRIYTEGQDDGDEDQEATLPDLQEGDSLKLLALEPRQHFTQPPPRFSQATLIKELEEDGIGRPSTYASIVSNILNREYVTLDERRTLAPTELGFLVTDLLVDAFPDILNVKFTAGMEDILDKVEEGEQDWVKAMKRFYAPFARDLKKAEAEMRDVKRQEIPTDIACEKCGAMMVVKWGRNGEFLACPQYPECKSTKNFTRGENGAVQVMVEQEINENCEQCGRPMMLRWGKYGRFLGCSGYPECKNIRSMDKPVDLGVLCPACKEGNMHEKKSRRGKVFYSCARYPECKFAVWDRPVAEPCPQCGEPILLEKMTKRAGRTRHCHKKECGYKAQVAEGAV